MDRAPVPGMTSEMIWAWFADPWIHALLTIAGGLFLAALLDRIAVRALRSVAKRTRGDLDDRLIDLLHRPAATTIVLFTLWAAKDSLHPRDTVEYLVRGILLSVGAVQWSWAMLGVGLAVLDALSHDNGLVQPRTRPLFDLIVRVFVVGAGIYFLFLAWHVDVTAWLASAGIIGVAVGFAAQETLANLFAGLSILVDRPYKIGDFLVLEGPTRGRVTEIGMRSTRLLTRDDVEVVIPNAQMASARIINESGGPHERERVWTQVGVAYDSDIDRVRDCLVECARECPDVVLDDPAVAPRVRFREFGDSGLLLHVQVWIPKPELRGRVLDDLNTRILKRFRAEGIEIPYPSRTVHVRRRQDPEDPEEFEP